MRNKTLLVANFKRHKGTMIAIFIMMLIVSLSLISVLTIWLHTNTYLQQELDRMQYGDITVWTQAVENEASLQSEIEQLEDVHKVAVQRLIYSNYTFKDTESDSEGQLIVYEPQQFPYRFFNETNREYMKEPTSIHAGDIYISFSLSSSLDITLGDTISFMIGRNEWIKTFTVKGTFEDPFMGSSMIGMKGFLISQEDYDEMQNMIVHAGIDAIARSGQMFHIEQNEQSTLSNAQFNQMLNEETTLSRYTAFAHSKDVITSFMLILQNVFTGLFLAFALLLLIVTMLIIGYSINASIEQDHKNMAILKTIGYDGSKLRKLLRIQYVTVILIGLLSGMLLSLFSIPSISSAMVSFAGILTPTTPQFALWLLTLLIFTLLFSCYIHFKTRKINTIAPVHMLQSESDLEMHATRQIGTLQQHGLMLRVSFRQLMSGNRRYISVCCTAILLVFFASMIGRMNTWLGSDGKGMMDAFNPADLDIGIQLLGNHDVKEMESIVQQYTNTTDSYALAMLGVEVEGVDYTANIITQPQRFHIQQGSTINSLDEIVITETIAADQNLTVNDQITVSYNGKSASFRIAGIYQCANDMGGNIGMSREGFLRIANETADMWCYHYFLEDPQQKQAIMDRLDNEYRGDVYVHENTWPGLFSIIAAMKTLLVVMYAITIIFIVVVTILTGNKLFYHEMRNLAIYKAIGFTTTQLRQTFAIRYCMVAILGSIIGILMSTLFTDRLIGTFMKYYGISNFASHLGIIELLIPGVIVCMLFTLVAYLTSSKIKKLEINELVAE